MRYIWDNGRCRIYDGEGWVASQLPDPVRGVRQLTVCVA